MGESYGPVIGAITLLLRAGEEAGAIRRGLDPDDILLFVSFLWSLDSGRGSQARADRILDLVMDGLGATPTSGPDG